MFDQLDPRGDVDKKTTVIERGTKSGASKDATFSLDS